jgi:hypothetical protein
MRLLLDTHVLLWAMLNSPTLGDDAAALLLRPVRHTPRHGNAAQIARCATLQLLVPVVKSADTAGCKDGGG